MTRNQAQDAQQIYDTRSTVYDDSWHPRFGRHIVQLAAPKPGETVMDLACGTGLASFPASTLVGPTGHVIGVDISNGMLKEAETKKASHDLQNIDFHQHSVIELDSLPAVQGRKFDVITCASALVLLENPGDALNMWASYLKPGGRLVTDVTHPHSQVAFMTLERVGRILNRPVPWYRLPFQGPDDLSRIMHAVDLKDVDVKLLSQLSKKDGPEEVDSYVCALGEPRIENVYEVGDAEEKFEKVIVSYGAADLVECGLREKAKEVFKQEWAKLANADGTIREVDGVFVGIGMK